MNQEPPNHQQLLEEARRCLELVRERLELRKQLQLSAEVENSSDLLSRMEPKMQGISGVMESPVYRIMINHEMDFLNFPMDGMGFPEAVPEMEVPAPESTLLPSRGGRDNPQSFGADSRDFTT